MLRRSPLRRKTRLRSRKPMRQRRAVRRRETRVRDTPRMLFVKTLPCCCPQPHVCVGATEAHHAGKKPGMKLKANDDTVIPLCTQGHQQCEDFHGPFSRFDHDSMRAWLDAQIARARELWDRRTSVQCVEIAF